jgi:TfoX/Sxy family transcriptional regulator of competence genes
MTDALPEFDRIVDALGREVERKQMMGSPILMHSDKMVACLDGDLLAVKLGRDRAEYAEALAVPGADIWSPQKGRTGFTDWVAIPVAQSGVWLDWVRTAIDLADEAALTAMSKPAKPRTGKSGSGKSGGGGGGAGI